MSPDRRPRRRKGARTVKVWRIRTLTGEAVRNLVAAWPRSLVTALVVSGLLGVLTWSELATTTGILAFHRDFITAGANVVVASNQEGIPAGRCAALASRPDVMSAGALTAGDVVDANTSPGTLFQTARITSGVLTVWVPSADDVEVALSQSIAVGNAAAQELGLEDGMYLGFGGNPPTPVTVIDAERRSPQTARWLLQSMAPLGRADSCWAELEPGAAPVGQTLLEHVFADTGPELAVRPWISLGDFARDPLRELAERPQAAAWFPAGVILTLLVWFGLWFRRSELSLYRILGATRVGLWYHTQTETIIILTVAGAIGCLWAAAAYGAATGNDPTIDQYAIAARTAISTLTVPAIIGPTAALITGSRSRLLNELKEG